MKTVKITSRGFSLIESLISLSLFLFILVTSLEFFIATREHFFSLKEGQELNQAAYATMDKIRLDLCQSGRGLLVSQSFGLLEAIMINGDTLITSCKDKDIALMNDLVAGQTFVPLASTTGINKGQRICIYDLEKGEVNTVASASEQGIVLSSPMNFSYDRDNACVILIRTISYYLDNDSRILRRKVNASPAQPLLEDVALFDFSYDAAAHMVFIRLILAIQEEKEYEISVFSKNMALVPTG